MNALACCLGVRGFTRLLVHEALALGLTKQGFGALAIVHGPRVVAEIELREIAVQVGF